MTLESQSCLETSSKYLQNFIADSINGKNENENNNNSGNVNLAAIVCSTRSTTSSRQAKVANNNTVQVENAANVPLTNSTVTSSISDGETKKCGVGPTLRSSARVPKRAREVEGVISDASAATNKKIATRCLKVESNPLEQAKTRRTWELWSVEDINSFFDALCEYGKDFENIQNFIVQKSRKKGHTQPIIKNKDQVRHFYYRTWHKISKHLHIENDIKKQVQELYGLINYGELRKKIGGRLDEKNGQKLKELVHNGVTTVRCKGKNVRIKTPVCRALKTLNDVEAVTKDGENVKLPNRIILEVRPRNNRSWSMVQSVSQNPRLRMDVNLQSRLAGILNYLQKRWRSPALKQKDEIISQNSELSECKGELDSSEAQYHLKLFPQKGAEINPVCVKTHIEVSNLNVSLQNYRFKKGLSVVSDPTNNEAANFCSKKNLKNKNKLAPKVIGDEKCVTETELNAVLDNNEKYSKEAVATLTDHELAMKQLLALETAAAEHVTPCFLKDSPLSPKSFLVPLTDANKSEGAKGECAKDEPGSKTVFIKPGWSLETCNTLTIGEVYLMLGRPKKLILEYEWIFESPVLTRSSSDTLSSVLNRLLQIASLTYVDLNKNKGGSSFSSCRCGHTCPISSVSSSSAKSTTGLRGNAKPSKCGAGKPSDNPNNSNSAAIMRSPDDVFRKPSNVQSRLAPKNLSPSEKIVPCDKTLKEQIDKYAQNRKAKGRMKKTFLVQRELPLLPKSSPTNHSVMTLRFVSTASQFVPLLSAPLAPPILTKTPTVEAKSVVNTFVGAGMPIITAATDARQALQPKVVVVNDSNSIFFKHSPLPSVNEEKLEIKEPESISTTTPNPVMSSLALGDSSLSSIVPVNATTCSVANIPQISISESSTTPTISVSPLTISSLLDMSLPGPEANVGIGTTDKLLDITLGNSTSDFCSLINLSGVANQSRSVGEVGSLEYRPVTPVNSPPNSLFKFSSPGLEGHSWFNGDVSDFSLTNFLSNLDSPVKTASNVQSSSTAQSQNNTSELMSNFHGLMNENCIDFTSKFEEASRK